MENVSLLMKFATSEADSKEIAFGLADDERRLAELDLVFGILSMVSLISRKGNYERESKKIKRMI
jgi:hypothetical protein